MKDDRVYLKHVLRCIARIENYTAAGRDSFFASALIQDGVIRNLQTLAESSQRLSDAIKVAYPDVELIHGLKILGGVAGGSSSRGERVGRPEGLHYS